MNLVTDKWIPVVRLDGRPDKVSLNEVFAQGDQIADLSVRPHERIALMRLLICIAQAALDGPNDDDGCRNAGQAILGAARAYLQNWQKAFEMFAEPHGFLQMPVFRDAGDSDNPVSKLDIDLATGSNEVLFDNAGSDTRGFSVDRLPLMLLAFQCFSVAGLIGQAKWGGAATQGRSAKPSPCIVRCMLHSFLRTESLLGSVLINLLPKNLVESWYGAGTWGKPVWEYMPQSLHDADAINNATTTYLGRLVPLSRAIRLDKACGTMILANGFDYTAAAYREPHATVITRDGDQREPLGGSVNHAIWRELQSIVVKGVSAAGTGGSLTLRNAPADSAFDIWVGAVVYDRQNVAKILDVVESVFAIPAAMLYDTGLKVYESGVKTSKEQQTCLLKAVGAYAKELKLEKGPVSAVLTAYWTALDFGSSLLLGVAAEPNRFVEWKRLTKASALEAFERHCPRLTPREIQAFAAGLRVLFNATSKLEAAAVGQEAA
jgi:CRISPR system Cascade subunit CasA